MNESLPSIGNLSSFNPSRNQNVHRSANESPESTGSHNIPEIKRNRSFKSRLSKNGAGSFKVRSKGSKLKDKDSTGKVNKKNIVKETMKLLKIGIAKRFSKGRLKSSRNKGNNDNTLQIKDSTKPNTSVLILNSKSKHLNTSPINLVAKVKRFFSK